MTHSQSSVRRRDLLLAGMASGAATLLPRRAFARERTAGPIGGGAPERARNVIFMVADGMSTGTLTLAHLARTLRDGKPSRWVELWNKPGVRRASATTFSADAHVTDSAAGGAAWGCGVHVPNGALNIDTAGKQWLPIIPHARQAGKLTGVVTTTRVTHATPASFIVNCVSREQEDRIAEQMLERKVDVALGGGLRHFPGDLLAKHSDYTLATSRATLQRERACAGKLLGLFANKHVPFELDRPETVPTLAEMTQVALERLAKGPEGFVLQIEGGRVDHAAHSNDAASLVAEQLAFDEAIGAVMKFVEGRDDTLVVLTTDHGNANPGLTLYGQRGKDAFNALLKAKRSFEFIDARIGGDAGKITSAVEEATGVRLKAAEEKMLAAFLRRERVMPFADMNVLGSVLGQVLATHFGVAFTSPNHTADMVEVTAFGPGSQNLRPWIDNIELHGLMVSALGLPPAANLDGMERVVKPRREESSD
jgi:alkaline phosphatase